MTVITHATLLDIDMLKDVFARFGPDGPDGDWVLPDWLVGWEARLEDEGAPGSRKARERTIILDKKMIREWPFSQEVVPHQVERAELIERQYAHLPPKVIW